VLLSILMNEIDSSLDTGQQFNAYANYEDEEREAENTQVLAAGTAVAKTGRGKYRRPQSETGLAMIDRSREN